jgi:hypothetical protein
VDIEPAEETGGLPRVGYLSADDSEHGEISDPVGAIRGAATAAAVALMCTTGVAHRQCAFTSIRRQVLQYLFADAPMSTKFTPRTT